MADTSIFTSQIKPTFCPGCGDYGIMEALKQALIDLGRTPDNTVICFDVGCNANMADFIRCYGFHGLHGRSVPPAVGIKLANHALTVISLIGDGGFYGEGAAHFLSLMRGNHDITVLVHDNHRYSLTTGQLSPTTPKGTKTASTPFGAIEEALNPLAIALLNHATFVARGFAGDIDQLKNLIVEAVRHEGFSLIDIMQPCVVWNKEQSYQWYRDRIYKLSGETGYKADDKTKAIEIALDENKLATGILFRENKPAYHRELPVLSKDPLAEQPIDKINISNLLEEFK